MGFDLSIFHVWKNKAEYGKRFVSRLLPLFSFLIEN